MSNEKAPHIAIISVKVEVQELLPTGECSGKPVAKSIIKEQGVTPDALATIKGYDLRDCLNKLKKKLEELNNDEG